MTTHVDFLATLFVVWGALTIVVGLATLALAVGASALVADPVAGGGQFAAGLAAALFLTLGLIAIVWGSAHVAVGLPLGRRRHWSRIAALMLGAIDLLLLPYGTALGGYALWTLLRQPVKAMFEKG